MLDISDGWERLGVRIAVYLTHSVRGYVGDNPNFGRSVLSWMFFEKSNDVCRGIFRDLRWPFWAKNRFNSSVSKDVLKRFRRRLPANAMLGIEYICNWRYTLNQYRRTFRVVRSRRFSYGNATALSRIEFSHFFRNKFRSGNCSTHKINILDELNQYRYK